MLILLALLTLGTDGVQTASDSPTLTTFDTSEQIADPAEEESQEETQQQPDSSAPVADAPDQDAPVLQQPSALPPTALPRPSVRPQPPAQTLPEPTPAPSSTSSIRAVVRPGSNYGPPSNTGRRGPPDTQVVGTAPDGSPLYAAQWYREPFDSEIEGYLSTANSPGWGLIACKTAPQWRVEECVIVGESPNGSGIARATLAASWQFLVRPPRLDGEYQVGAWVRIRMNYSIGGGPGG